MVVTKKLLVFPDEDSAVYENVVLLLPFSAVDYNPENADLLLPEDRLDWPDFTKRHPRTAKALSTRMAPRPENYARLNALINAAQGGYTSACTFREEPSERMAPELREFNETNRRGLNVLVNAALSKHTSTCSFTAEAPYHQTTELERELRRMYVEQHMDGREFRDGVSVDSLATELGFSPSTIYRDMNVIRVRQSE